MDKPWRQLMKGHALQSFLLQEQLKDSYKCSSQLPCRIENTDSVLAVNSYPYRDPERGLP